MRPVATNLIDVPHDDRPFVLVHGMYHGGWCWRQVASQLRTAGVATYVPTLTGLGERSHLLSPAVGFRTHVEDVVNVIDWEGLDDVILVGHSYGGTVVHRVADLVPERIGRVVYLDSTHFDLERLDPEVRPRPPEEPEPTGPAGVMCYPVPRDPTRWGVTSNDLLAWILPRLSAQPTATRADAREFTADPMHDIRRTYIACLRDAWGKPVDSASRPVWERVASSPLFKLVEIDEPHEAFFTNPALVARLFLEARAETEPRSGSRL